MPFCKRCGTEYADGDAYCNTCGIRLADGGYNAQAIHTGPKIKNTIIWWVAFMPLIGLAAENALAIVFQTSIVSLWWVTSIADIVLCLIDQERITKAYPQTPVMKAWIFLIPVYLFKRAKALKQSLAYFIVWIVLFGAVCFIPQSFILNNPVFNFGLGSSPTIETVKKSDAQGYPGMPLGQAIDEYLLNEKWTSFNSDTGRQIVQVEGKTPSNGEKAYSLLIQFTVNSDATSNVTYLSVDGQSQDVGYFTYFLDVIYGRYGTQTP